MKFRFCADDGSSIEAVTIGEGMDSGDKATNKAMAVAFKYACFQVFCIPTEEMKDPDADTPEPNVKADAKHHSDNQSKDKTPEHSAIDSTKVTVLRDKIMKKGISEKSMLEYYKIDSFEKMDLATWNNAMQLLDKYKDKGVA